ncbi:MAG: hypothetical protein SGILL_000563 [Bacillariaceae sp.]
MRSAASKPDLSYAPRSLRGLVLDDADSINNHVINSLNNTIHNQTENNNIDNTPPPYHDVSVTLPPTSSVFIPGNSNSTQQPPQTQSQPFIDERLGLIIFLVSTITSIFLVLTMILREYYFKKHGIDVCPLFSWTSPQERAAMTRRARAANLQHDADWALAEILQRQLNEEGREGGRIAKRQERRKWYEYFLKPHTMTVQKDDIFYAHDTLEGEDGVNDNIMSLPAKLRRMSTDFSDIDDSTKKVPEVELTGSFEEEEEDMESAKKRATSTTQPEEEHSEHSCGCSCSEAAPVLCDSNDEDARRYLKLPVKNEEGIFRHVDGECALCIEDYEEGDVVVWSDLKCTHAFHKECIMQWLSKGKKRCPVCRHWFVPGAKIEDQKKLHGEEWERANIELTQKEDEQMVQDAMDQERGEDDGCESQDIVQSATEESEIAQSASAGLEPQPCSEPSESERQLQLRDGVARSVSIATIEECTASAPAIAHDCTHPELPMNISTETEEAMDSNNMGEEVV